jgi:hypothetical protein
LIRFNHRVVGSNSSQTAGENPDIRHAYDDHHERGAAQQHNAGQKKSKSKRNIPLMVGWVISSEDILLEVEQNEEKG